MKSLLSFCVVLIIAATSLSADTENPSEAEVLENGVNMVDIQVKMLKKIDEQMLYMIELQKEKDELKKKPQLSRKG